MPLFSQNVLTQVAGSSPILAQEVVYGQKGYWNVQVSNVAVGVAPALPIDLTGTTITARIIRREITNLVQSARTGWTFNIASYTTATPTPIDITVNVVSASQGLLTVVIDETTWNVLSSDPELNISSVNPVAFTGNIKIEFPANGQIPVSDTIIFLLFLVRSDGVTN